MINLLGKRLYLKTSVLDLVNLVLEVVYLTLPPHIFSIQVKFGAFYITGHWGRVQNKIKET